MRITINDKIDGIKIKEIWVDWWHIDAEQSYHGHWTDCGSSFGRYTVKGCRLDILTTTDSMVIITLEDNTVLSWDKDRQEYVLIPSDIAF